MGVTRMLTRMIHTEQNCTMKRKIKLFKTITENKLYDQNNLWQKSFLET